jgi:group I intron endonuclease
MGAIYCITNLVNGKQYVGQTKKTPEERFKQHLGDAKAGVPGLHGAIAKHGFVAFTVSLVESVTDDQLDERERFWIASYGTFGGGYNLTTGGEGGYKRSPESRAYTSKMTKLAFERDPTLRVRCGSGMRGKHPKASTIQKMSESRRGVRNPNFGKTGTKHPASQSRVRSVEQSSLTGEVIATYPSGREAMRQTGVHYSNIASCASGNRQHAGGFVWHYV